MTEGQQIDLNRSHITTPDAAKRSGFTKGYVTLLLRNGGLEGFRYGGAKEWFVYVDSLEQFLAKPRKPGPKGPHKKSAPQTHQDTPLANTNDDSSSDNTKPNASTK